MSEQSVSRRNLLQSAGIAVGAGVLGVVGYTVYGPGGHDAPYTSSGGNSSGTVLAPVAEIPDGGGVVLTNAKIVLTRTGKPGSRVFRGVHSRGLLGEQGAERADHLPVPRQRVRRNNRCGAKWAGHFAVARRAGSHRRQLGCSGVM
jgi:hypothetical protein